MTINCIIVDDEKMAVEFLHQFCKKSDKVNVMATFNDPADALAYLKENKTDLVFLDVEMPGLTGFNLLDNLPYKPKIVLTTSKTEYAFEAFQYRVDDYLKKPITYPRFTDAIDKIYEQLASQATPNSGGGGGEDNIFIKTDGKLLKLNYDEILYLESMGDYVKFVVTGKKYLTLNTLSAIEEKLDKTRFIRVHRSYIVNLSKIKDIQGATLLVEGNVIPISKSHKDEVLQKIKIL
jgi:DNA-binding LytR/AlgR family response regulator